MGTTDELNHTNNQNQNQNQNKKRKSSTPEGNLRFALDTCSKHNDLSSAIALYENALAQEINLNICHFNTLLYLCSNSISDPAELAAGQSTIDNGFRIFNHMLACNISPTEATITAMARLAAAKDDGDLAFKLVKDMEKYKLFSRLRTYGPALLTYCRKGEAENAYSVEKHMVEKGIVLEEPEICALLKVSVECKREEKVYSYLQKLRDSVKCVSGATVEIIENWFSGELASEVGTEVLDVGNVREAILRNGGGWHGLGWLGKGKWVVCRSQISSSGSCLSCGENLVCVDTDQAETNRFAESIASLAMKREAKAKFSEFQEWLEKHTDYEAVVDGANVGFYQQNFAGGGFTLSQISTVVKDLYKRSHRWPLVILHSQRVQQFMEVPANRQILEEWRAQDALYTAPKGSNDDWYWIYAAVKAKSLIVTNDEMRDHIFELLGQNFFLKWKERHQVHYTFVKGEVKLQMPPSYSTVIQESEKGSWHFPIEVGTGETMSWLCVSRQSTIQCSAEVPLSCSDVHAVDAFVRGDNRLLESCSTTGKRKR